MNHLLTRYLGEGIEMLFSTPEMKNKSITFDFRRAVIGLIYPQLAARGGATTYAYACVVGERVRVSTDTDRPFTRGYVVLDEADGADPDKFFQDIVSLKDRYFVSTVFCPKSPPSSFENLRDMEGLCHYWDKPTPDLRAEWPTFVTKDTVAGLYSMEEPDFIVIQQDLNKVLREELVDPGSRWPVLARGAQVMHRLMFPEDLPNKKIREGLGTSHQLRMTALWFAVQGLENTMRWMPDMNKGWVHKKGIGTGY
jgi:hypothetical protein